MQEDFQTAIFSVKGLLLYCLPDATDLWQPVDARYACCLKSLIDTEHLKWLDIESNLERRFGDDEQYKAKEKSILITRRGIVQSIE